MSAIELINVSKRYGETVVFDNFSHSFKMPGVSCIMGQSGCGKTTLLRMILGLEAPDSGEVKIPEGTVFGCMFQEDRLIEHLSALKNLKLVMRDSYPEAAKQILTELGLDNSLTKPVKYLSGGMARRVSLARALIYEANTVILDEPLKGLDEDTKRRAIEVIKLMTMGKTLIIVTHDVTEAQSFGGKMVKLHI